MTVEVSLANGRRIEMGASGWQVMDGVLHLRGEAGIIASFAPGAWICIQHLTPETPKLRPGTMKLPAPDPAAQVLAT